MLIKATPIPNRLPRFRTREGIQEREKFRRTLLGIGGDVPLLWLPKSTDTTTTTTADRNARTLTYDGSIASRLGMLGSGPTVSFDGLANYGSVPDAANLSFGDGVTDSPFSIAAWFNQTASAGAKEILNKFDITTGNTKQEWRLVLDASEKLILQLVDDSASAYIGRTYNTALATGTPIFIVATYSGSKAASGIKLYAWDGTAAGQVDDTDYSNGVYVAMENKAGLCYLGASRGAAALVNYFLGSMGCVMLAAQEWGVDEIWELKVAGNAFFDLSF